MRAVLRLSVMVFAAGLALAPATALAQDATNTTTPTTTPATDAVGPRDLQNFSLSGTVTRSAEPIAVPGSTSSRRAAHTPRDDSATVASTQPTPARTAPPSVERSQASAPVRTAAIAPAPRPSPPIARPQESKPSSSPTVSVQALDAAPVSTASDAPSTPAADVAAEHRLLLWPWLLAALVLGAAGAFLYWRNQRSREAFAGGPQIDVFRAPDARPETLKPVWKPAPAPTEAPPAPPVGIVSTRLRPWVDLVFRPGRCIVEDDKVSLEFELGLQNSGNAAARAVLVEATLMNAGPHQDQEVSAFYDAPVGEGERIQMIPPLKTVLVKTKVVAPRSNVRLIEIGGRHVFVPLIAFNALYSWGGGEGQTSASYMLGRDGKGDKLGPFRLDLGPRIFRNIGARTLPIAIRR